MAKGEFFRKQIEDNRMIHNVLPQYLEAGIEYQLMIKRKFFNILHCVPVHFVMGYF